MTCDTANLLLASDLHLDVGRYDLRAQIFNLQDQGQRIDAVVLAGDLMEAASGDPVAYAASQVPSDIPTAFIPGNHDFYGGRLGNLVNRWRARAKGSHVHVLVNERMTVAAPGGEIVLLGSPLWSNLEGLGPVIGSALRKSVHRRIADFSCMFASNGQAWTVRHMLEEFEKSQRFLAAELSPGMMADGRRRVVVTHFCPHRNSISPQWRDDDLSAYFCNHLPELVEQADLWLHGHTHDACDYRVGDDPARGRVICHPRGYAGGVERDQALRYAPRLIQMPVARVAWPAVEPGGVQGTMADGLE